MPFLFIGILESCTTPRAFPIVFVIDGDRKIAKQGALLSRQPADGGCVDALATVFPEGTADALARGDPGGGHPPAGDLRAGGAASRVPAAAPGAARTGASRRRHHDPDIDPQPAAHGSSRARRGPGGDDVERTGHRAGRSGPPERGPPGGGSRGRRRGARLWPRPRRGGRVPDQPGHDRAPARQRAGGHRALRAGDPAARAAGAIGSARRRAATTSVAFSSSRRTSRARSPSRRAPSRS